MNLSFTEKRNLQKTVQANLAALAAGGVSFSEKRRIQKETSEALVKLGTKGTGVDPQPLATIEQVSAVMKDTGMGSGWFMVPEKSRIVDDGVKQGWLLRPSVSQVEWTEAGVELARASIPAPTPKTKADVVAVMPMLKNFIGQSQLSALGSAMYGEEKQYFFDKLTDLADLIEKMPSTYQTDGQGDKAIAYLHYFKGGSDWYITEKDKGDVDDPIQGVQQQAFGYAILNGDKQNAESGYISIQELISNGVELDLYWQPKSLGTIKGKGKEPATVSKKSFLEKLKDAVVSVGGQPESFSGNAVVFNVNGNRAEMGDFGNGSEESGFYEVNIVDADEKVVVKGGLFETPEGAATWAANQLSKVPQSQKLTDLLSGKYDDLQPEAYMTIVQDVISEINAVDPVKPAVLAYIQKAKDKGLITESAAMAAFEAILNGK